MSNRAGRDNKPGSSKAEGGWKNAAQNGPWGQQNGIESVKRGPGPGTAVVSNVRGTVQGAKTQTASVDQQARKPRRPVPIQEVDLTSFMDLKGPGQKKKKKNKDKDTATAPVEKRKTKFVPKKSAVVANPNVLDSTVRMMVRKGKQRMSGKKKKRISTLRKNIYRGRRARLYLVQPDVSPIPLQKHPSLAGYVQFKSAEINSEDNLMETVLHEEEEEEEDDGEIVQENENDDEISEDCINLETTESQQESETEDDDEEGENDRAIQDVLKSYQENLDVRVISPIFFQSTFVPRTLVIGEEVSPTTQDETGEMKYKKTTKALPLAKPVRDYVNQGLSDELDEVVSKMLTRLMELQERLRFKDPQKALMRRRLVFGLREVTRGVRSRRCKCIIVAPNIEQGSTNVEKGIDQTVLDMMDKCAPNENEIEQGLDGVPIVFALTKSKIGAALGKKRKVSAVGIYSADGAHAEYKEMLSLASELRAFHKRIVNNERTVGEYASCQDCNKLIDSIRFDCYNCGRVRCAPCKASAKARNVACTQDQAQRVCQMIAVSRAVPAHVIQQAQEKQKRQQQQHQKKPSKAQTSKKMNPKAKEFVPQQQV